MLGIIVLVVASNKSVDNAKERHKAHFHYCSCCDDNKQIALCTMHVQIASRCAVDQRTSNRNTFGPMDGIMVLVPCVCSFVQTFVCHG